MGVFVSNWGRHIAMEARFVSKVSGSDPSIGGSQVLSMGQVMQVWVGSEMHSMGEAHCGEARFWFGMTR